MTLILAVIPVLLLIILMAFFKMSGDKSSIISLIVTMLIALFGFAFSVDNLFYSFLYGALKAVSPILIIILMAIFSYNVLLKTEKMEIIKQQFASISTGGLGVSLHRNFPMRLFILIHIFFQRILHLFIGRAFVLYRNDFQLCDQSLRNAQGKRCIIVSHGTASIQSDIKSIS